MSPIQSQSTCLQGFPRGCRPVSLTLRFLCVRLHGSVPQYLGCFFAFLCACLSVVRCAADDVQAGLLFDLHTLTLEAGWRTEAAGPFFYQQQAELGNVWAVPPLFSHSVLLDGDVEEYDFAYPLLTYDRYGG